jgi:amidase
VKCNVNTSEFPASAGSYALHGAAPATENGAIARLKRAGAVILGSANMSQWANWRTKNFGDDGWSATGGQAHGAYHERMDPNGSSSGSAVGVDLGMAVLAVGSEVSCDIAHYPRTTPPLFGSSC